MKQQLTHFLLSFSRIFTPELNCCADIDVLWDPASQASINQLCLTDWCNLNPPAVRLRYKLLSLIWSPSEPKLDQSGMNDWGLLRDLSLINELTGAAWPLACGCVGWRREEEEWSKSGDGRIQGSRCICELVQGEQRRSGSSEED